MDQDAREAMDRIVGLLAVVAGPDLPGGPATRWPGRSTASGEEAR